MHEGCMDRDPQNQEGWCASLCGRSGSNAGADGMTQSVKCWSTCCWMRLLKRAALQTQCTMSLVPLSRPLIWKPWATLWRIVPVHICVRACFGWHCRFAPATACGLPVGPTCCCMKWGTERRRWRPWPRSPREAAGRRLDRDAGYPQRSARARQRTARLSPIAEERFERTRLHARRMHGCGSPRQ